MVNGTYDYILNTGNRKMATANLQRNIGLVPAFNGQIGVLVLFNFHKSIEINMMSTVL